MVLTVVFGFPFLAMSILILATYTSNIMNIYSSGLAFNNLLNRGDKNRSKTKLIRFIWNFISCFGCIITLYEFYIASNNYNYTNCRRNDFRLFYF